MANIEQQADVLIKIREEIFAAAQRTFDAFKKITPDDVDIYKPRYDDLKSLQKKFEEVQESVINFNAKIDTKTFHPLDVSNVRVSFEDVVYAAQKRYLAVSKLTPTTPAVKQPSANLALSLPTIKIPSYNGDLAQWPEFYALFHSLVDQNIHLNEVQKFHYLRASLQDTALSTISSFQISTENYPLAYKALISRYQNKRLLASMYIQQVLDFTPLKSGKHAALQHFLNVHRSSIDAIKSLDIGDLADFLLLSLTISHLDPQTRKQFESTCSTHVTPTYKQVIEFIEEQSRTLELCGLDQPIHSSSTKPKPASSPSHALPVRKINSLLASETLPAASSRNLARSPGRGLLCPLCKANHTLYVCSNFLNQSVAEKYTTLRNLKRCFNCLGNHERQDCISQGSCRECNSKLHHSLLHTATQTNPSVNVSVDSRSGQTNKPTVGLALACQLKVGQPLKRTALLGTVRAMIKDNSGQYQPFRAIIDSGSQVSVITLSLTKRLGLKLHATVTELSGIGHESARVHGIAHCEIASRFNPHHPFGVQALVLSTITGKMPASSIPLEVFEKYRGLSLADDQFHISDQVDFLLGADLYPDLLQRTGDVVIRGSPSALNTVFGWVVMGPVQTSESGSHNPLSLLASSADLDHTLRLFWESEEVLRPPHKDPEEQLCEDHFVSSYTRDETGRYSVSLPFKPSVLPLASNRTAVLQNYLSLERRLKRNTEQDEAYQQFMRDYVASQHMQTAPQPSQYVIPHHCVHKSTSSSTKLRVVFNASAQDSNGASLNKNLLNGPKLQADLPSILTTFRTHAIAICADIRQMYRQILIQPDDRIHQHIFWRPSQDSPVVEYQLNTVTYGLTPSAFLAQRVLRQLVDDEGDRFPLASHAIKHQTYIDDIVSGACDLTQARTLQSELQALLACGGFELRKWASNNSDALTALPHEHLETPLIFSTEEQGIKILGLLWDPRSDSFSFHTQPFSGSVTKRSTLSYIARIFDPIGFLTPFVGWMKMFLQQLWLTQLHWDDLLPEQLVQSWLSAIADVSKLSNFRIPRAFPDSHGINRLVGFCDASEKGFAAVLYLHTQSSTASHVTLLRAKSKVAPLKPLTIPKLELSSALMLSRLIETTLPSISTLPVDSVVLYTDSTIVLAWLATPPHRLKTFVANRVVQVLETSRPSNWAHVPSEENPADCASRGLLPAELLDHPLWLTGPPFLHLPHEEWPRYGISHDAHLDLPELKTSVATLVTYAEPDFLLLRLEKFSSLLRAQRVFGHVVRFTRILLAKRNHMPLPSGPLRPPELQDALNLLIRVTQQHYYSSEFRKVSRNETVSSGLASLNPFIDQSGHLRVAGRLRHSLLPEESRHPILLPKQAHLSSLICDHFHKISLHSGPRTVQALIQERYWIVSLRGLLRQRIHRCLTCHKFRAKPLQPKMADLPAARVQPSRAFAHVGTDFAGPFSIKTSNRRKAPTTKGYLCLFVCMAIKAVHLEMVSELSTEAFLAAFDRFTARRGLPSHIYSDCGRNYVGAARHLREVHEFLERSETSISDSLAGREVTWHFNPPYAPNFGGLWEAGVKSAKSLLYRLITDTPHTHEEYATLFARIEAVLNSRPLCATPQDPAEGPDYLSPGHLLIGTSLLAPPERAVPDNPSHLSRWHRVRQLHQAFWVRWSREYLHTQMQRGKWTRGSPELKVGDVVFFVEAARSPLSWPIGRVEQLHPGRDGIVRVACIRTASGSYNRPVNKLLVLPVA